MGLLDANGWIDSGKIMFEGEDLTKYSTEDEWINIRGGKKNSHGISRPNDFFKPTKNCWETGSGGN